MKIDPCIKKYPINKWFIGSHFHHFHLWKNDNFGAYIPKDIHRLTYHNSKTGEGMRETNVRVYNWLAVKYNVPLLDVNKRITKSNMESLSLRIDTVSPKRINLHGSRGRTKKVDDGKHSITIRLLDEEHEALTLKIGASSAENWHDFILLSAKIITKKDLKKQTKKV